MPAEAIDAALATLRPDPSEVATMLLSGGTTSLSKLIPRTHDDYVLNARLCGRAGGFDESTVFMAILPLGHNYNLASPGMLGTFYYGGTWCLAPPATRRRCSPGRARARDDDRRRRAADFQLAEFAAAGRLRSVLA